MKRLLPIVLLASLALPGLAAESAAKLAPRLVRALDSGESPAWRDGGVLTVWLTLSRARGPTKKCFSSSARRRTLFMYDPGITCSTRCSP